MDTLRSDWSFACPICRNGLVPRASAPAATGGVATDPWCGILAACAQCKRDYACRSRIWRFLPAEAEGPYEQFLREYRIVRENRGWGRPDPTYFLALPHVAPDDPQRAIWRRRSESCRLLFMKIIEPMAARLGRPLRILDLGAGNCWLAYRLTQLGHRVAAIDLSVDVTDGLGAHVWYGPALERARHVPFTPIQAEFDRLPLPDRTVDLAVFNASLHYSTEYGVTLREALRVLAPEGGLIIMDSPVYRYAGSGEQMVHEREMEFEHTYGFRSDSLPAEHFLTKDRLEELSHDLALCWQMYAPACRVGSSDLRVEARLVRALKSRLRRLRGLRELAEMPVIAGFRRS